ncbi:MAG TPA: TauD/TfdA family dioxygenase [Jatrophihabitans sp.]|jgi:hypothetical protein
MPLDVVSLAQRCAVVPERTDSPERAAELMWRDGAAVLTGIGTDEVSAGKIAALVLGDGLLGAGRPIEVTDGGGMDKRRYADAARKMMPLHTDGFAYGAAAPDVFFLVCATPSPGDGHSFLVDQAALLDSLAESPDGAELAMFIREHVVDQSEPGAVHSALGPVALALPSGVRAIRRSLDVRPVDDEPNPAYVSRMLTLWQGLLDTVGALAERFVVGEGEALAIDNTRLAHGRDGYTRPGRSLWRCWAWTDRAGSVPDGELWSDTRMLFGAV